MTHIKSQWQTRELATGFLSGVRGAIPGAALQLSIIEKIVRLWCRSPANILDLGCGDGILGRSLLGVYPQARGVFADFSEPMLQAAREKLTANPDAIVLEADFGEPDWVGSVTTYGPFDIVVSGFSIHHQPDHRKKELYSEIFELLAPRGVFLNLEHVASQSPAGRRLFDEFFIDHLYAFHGRSDPTVSREEIAANFYARPDKQENILAPVGMQCGWLEDIGFADVDCFFKAFELALFGGRKGTQAEDGPPGQSSPETNRL